MEIALGIIGTLFFVAMYLVCFIKIDVDEKCNNGKTYKIGFWKYIMVRYTRKNELVWKNGREVVNPKAKKDPVNANTISRLAFWFQIVHHVYLSALVVLVILNNASLLRIYSAARIMIIIYLALLFALFVFYAIRGDLSNKKRKQARLNNSTPAQPEISKPNPHETHEGGGRYLNAPHMLIHKRNAIFSLKN